jgi:hypothetical protein
MRVIEKVKVGKRGDGTLIRVEGQYLAVLSGWVSPAPHSPQNLPCTILMLAPRTPHAATSA